MKKRASSLSEAINAIGPRYLPFADAATSHLPLARIMRLSLFQITVGMAIVLLNGTLNRVMIVELGVPAWLVSVMVALPLVFAPVRAFIGFRSDHHRSALGWKRVPYIWFGTLAQFGGLAIMPFALIVLSGDSNAPGWMGPAAAALAFLITGAGLHTVQTAGLALATDLAPPKARPRVVALLYVMLLVGMLFAALAFGWLLADFSELRLIRVVQGAGLLTMVLNLAALWKQEPRRPGRTIEARPAFRETWRAFLAQGGTRRFMLAVGLGTAGFSMQDILLEPYGGQILGLSVSATTELTALLAAGTLVAFAIAARALNRGVNPHRLAAIGALIGIVAFTIVIFAAPLASGLVFRIGTTGIGFGGGLFAVGTLIAAMTLTRADANGLALGAWGAVQATAAGAGLALGGVLRDTLSELARHGALGAALNGPATGYGLVYCLEIVLLFVTLAVIGPLARYRTDPGPVDTKSFGIAEFPG
ncbi:BCD family MFS transporter [Salinisphaera sp. Q1T1-3]|uniref:BCD family MFS transporter n=1 Tax=Salinisphaera sp. Q1T1-3 TaxID=2321229 RepID=UPI000E716A2B|nr:BCD family MFS transporter [Salinisphaera sp. Q1T1-3]RJS92082.1 MFS transporter [Salinisphaera sp. Q1T1-3]